MLATPPHHPRRYTIALLALAFSWAFVGSENLPYTVWKLAAPTASPMKIKKSIKTQPAFAPDPGIIELDCRAGE